MIARRRRRRRRRRRGRCRNNCKLRLQMEWRILQILQKTYLHLIEFKLQKHKTKHSPPHLPPAAVHEHGIHPRVFAGTRSVGRSVCSTVDDSLLQVQHTVPTDQLRRRRPASNTHMYTSPEIEQEKEATKGRGWVVTSHLTSSCPPTLLVGAH